MTDLNIIYFIRIDRFNNLFFILKFIFILFCLKKGN